MHVTFDMKYHVPNDELVSLLFTSELGNNVRTYAPVGYLGWSKVPLEDKQRMWEKLLVLFELDMSNPKILEYVDRKMRKLYSVHQHFLKCGTHEKGRATLPKSDIWNGRPKSHSQWLCNLYASEDFQEISKINTTNRYEQKYHHKGGAKPFFQHAKNPTRMI